MIMNIFKAKEIYKRIPGLPSSQNPLRVIRGLWVSGTHLDILTEDAFMHLDNVQMVPCEIRRYTDTTGEWKYTDPNIEYMNLYDTGFDITNYYTSSGSWDNDVNIQYVNIYDQSMDITEYQTVSTEIDHDPNIQYMTLHDDELTLEPFNYPVYKVLPDITGVAPAEPTLEILSYTSTALDYDFD